MKAKKKFETPNLTVEELSEELVITNIKLAKANAQLRKEQEARAQMFSSISHDLRAPITAIKNAVELLSSMETYDAGQVQPLLRLLERRIATLEQLINDIFFLISIENNCIHTNDTPLPLGFFLEDYFFTQEADTRYQNRNLLLTVPEDLDVTVFIDPHQLERILDNLFTNALKYSSKNDQIQLSATKGETTVTISVKDTGIGISKEHLDKIFDRCYIVEKARTPEISSTGLGLSITKALVEHYSGSIVCESTPGQGSCFSFTLPIFNETCFTTSHLNHKEE